MEIFFPNEEDENQLTLASFDPEVPFTVTHEEVKSAVNLMLQEKAVMEIEDKALEILCKVAKKKNLGKTGSKKYRTEDDLARKKKEKEKMCKAIS